MKTNLTSRRRAFRDAIQNAGIDLEKNFFSLSFSDISKLEEIRKSFGYDGKNNLGRSRARQFYYSAQKA